MIEFKGKITGKAFKFYVGRYKKIFSVSWVVSSLVVSGLFRTYMLFVPFLFLLFLLLLCPSKAFAFLLPYRVYIDLEDRTITSVVKGKPEYYRMIDDIVEVKDHGEFYTFKFTSPRNYIVFIAQKDLLTQGTIEEFEAIFEEVLVRVK